MIPRWARASKFFFFIFGLVKVSLGLFFFFGKGGEFAGPEGLDFSLRTRGEGMANGLCVGSFTTLRYCCKYQVNGMTPLRWFCVHQQRASTENGRGLGGAVVGLIACRTGLLFLRGDEKMGGGERACVGV